MKPDNLFKWALFLVFFSLVSTYSWLLIASVFELSLEMFLRENRGVLISLGTLFLVSFLALLTSRLSDNAADRREKLVHEMVDRRERRAMAAAEKQEKTSQRVQAELQISQFRQAWIKEMRQDIADLLNLSFHSASEADVAKAYTLSMKIEMRLNPEEDAAQELSEALSTLSGASGNDAAHVAALTKVVTTSRNYLKGEWDRLKQDIRKAQLLEKELQ